MSTPPSCQEVSSYEGAPGPETLRPSGVFPTPPPATGDLAHRAPRSRRPSRAGLQTLDGFIEPEPAPPSGLRSARTALETATAIVEASLGIAGAFACAVVSLEDDTLVHSQCKRSSFDVDVCAIGYARSAAVQSAALRQAGVEPSIGEFAVTLGDQVHLAMPLDRTGEALVFIAVDRKLGHLNLTRLSLKAILARTCSASPA